MSHLRVTNLVGEYKTLIPESPKVQSLLVIYAPVSTYRGYHKDNVTWDSRMCISGSCPPGLLLFRDLGVSHCVLYTLMKHRT